MMMFKAQSALEYIMIIALSLAIIIPTAYLFYKFSSESNIQVTDAQMNEIGRNIIDTAETVYFSGKDSQVVLDINMPKNLYDAYILKNRELVFKLYTEIGESERVFFSSEDIDIASNDPSLECRDNGNCDLSSIGSSGLKRVQIKAVGDGSGGVKIEISKFEG